MVTNTSTKLGVVSSIFLAGLDNHNEGWCGFAVEISNGISEGCWANPEGRRYLHSFGFGMFVTQGKGTTMPDVAATATEAKYVVHDWLRLSANVAQCKRCNVFWVEAEYGPMFRFYEDEGTELDNMPHCAWQEA